MKGGIDVEIWFDKKSQLKEAQKALEEIGFEVEILGKKIIVPINAFSIRAQLLIPHEKLFPKITQVGHDFDIEFPRETGIYKMGGATITIEYKCSDLQDSFQLYQGISSSLKNLHELYMAIKAGRALPGVSWSVDQIGPSGEDAIRSAENLAKESRNKKQKENFEEP